MFPANNFGAQEPGTDEEIAEFCTSQYAVTFPVMSKISVVGDDQHPLYATLTDAAPTADGKDAMREGLRGHGMSPTEDPDVLWNFEKFLIARDGTVVGRFAPPSRRRTRRSWARSRPSSRSKPWIRCARCSMPTSPTTPRRPWTSPGS